MSLYDLQSGHNVFARAPADDPRGLGLTETRLSLHRRHPEARPRAVRGLRADGQQLQALVRQGAMSYFTWAPVFNSYGSNNRTNSVRVPAGGGRCESRNADGAVNPYLAATLALAAGLDGVREQDRSRQSPTTTISTR